MATCYNSEDAVSTARGCGVLPAYKHGSLPLFPAVLEEKRGSVAMRWLAPMGGDPVKIRPPTTKHYSPDLKMWHRAESVRSFYFKLWLYRMWFGLKVQLWTLLITETSAHTTPSQGALWNTASLQDRRFDPLQSLHWWNIHIPPAQRLNSLLDLDVLCNMAYVETCFISTSQEKASHLNLWSTFAAEWNLNLL